jgi:hypothetical protein
MRFTLIYDGPLPAGPTRRAEHAAKIRNQLHSQMRDLWDNHVVLRQLARTARTIPNPNAGYYTGSEIIWSPVRLPEYDDPIRPLLPGQTDFCVPIEVAGGGSFLPIVRRSLYLACAVDILFLRHEEPLHLFEASGDIDNRLKCFFDGLTVPNREQAAAGESPCASPLCCLLEDDKLISDFSIRTGRLLGKSDKRAHDVRIQADITIRVMRVMDQNLCLVGD